MKICLLGGSNSVMTYGISSGLCHDNDLQIPLGATSSLQNIHALISNDIMMCDIIVTESNVNDSYNIGCANYPKELVLDNIRSLYDELYRTGKMVISLILPIMPYKNHVESKKLIDEVNDLHRSLCFKYGFNFIDMAAFFSKFSIDNVNTNIIMPDIRHPLESFMHELGTRLRDYAWNCINMQPKYFKRNRIESNFYFINNFPELPIKHKTNSKFQRKVNVLYDEININSSDGYLCGIETWSDGISQLVITCGSGSVLVKNFGELLSFNEITKTSLDCFNLRSHTGKALLITEPSVNVGNKESIESLVAITSLMFKRKNADISDININVSRNISFLIPNIEHHIAGIKRFMKEYNLVRIDDIVNDSLLESLDKAVNLINDDHELSENLIKFIDLLKTHSIKI